VSHRHDNRDPGHQRAQVDGHSVTFPNQDAQGGGFLAAPSGEGPHPGLVVVPENLGLTEHRRRETLEMASRGFAVLTVNLYMREGGEPPQGPFANDEERRRANFLAMPDEQAVGDILAAGEWLASQPDVGDVGVIGFCSGGGQAFVAACTRPGPFDCLVSVYGTIVLPGELTPDRAPLSRLPLTASLSIPLQAHYGEADHVVPITDVQALETELSAHNLDAELFRYPGAGHVFAAPWHPNYDPEATASLWPRVYRFLDSHLSP
jgi:carboxymethylenebutenolidase